MTRRTFGLWLLFCLGGTGCARQDFFQPDALLPGTTLPATADSARVTAGRHYKSGFLKRALFGPHYRRVWAQPVTLPVLDVRTVKPGGLEFGKMGGGFQTISATLFDAQGRAYALRSLDKNPYKTLPKVLRHTFVLNVVRDATSAGNPYGAFVVPPLAEAAGILHTNPRPYYVRNDETGLGPGSEPFRGRVVMLEEKPENKANLKGGAYGPNATDLMETDDLLELVYQDSQHRIDQQNFLRARLLDLLVGDWDRHEGQWDWVALQQASNKTVYRPIPVDRDQVFFRFGDGAITWLASRPWLIAKFRTFKPQYESIEGYTRNAKFIDSRALNEMSKPQFTAAAKQLQQALTDEVISRAAHQLPPEVYRLEGAYLEKSLRRRRDELQKATAEFYRLLAKEVLVPGTDAAERFVVERQSDTLTLVSVYSRSNDDKPGETLLYRRGFHPHETKQIDLHGLGGKDVFELYGTVRHSPFINIYGGPGEDTVADSSHVAGLRKKTRFYDTKRNNEYEPAPELKINTTRGVRSHAFDRDGSGR